MRVGVASSDRDGILATPVATIPRAELSEQRLGLLLAETEAFEIVVGLPLSLSGSDTASTQDARDVAGWLAEHATVPVRLIDERMSTVSAQRALHSSGRTTKRSRTVIDQAAAVIILQTALDAEKTTGNPPGVLVQTEGRP